MKFGVVPLTHRINVLVVIMICPTNFLTNNHIGSMCLLLSINGHTHLFSCNDLKVSCTSISGVWS